MLTTQEKSYADSQEKCRRTSSVGVVHDNAATRMSMQVWQEAGATHLGLQHGLLGLVILEGVQQECRRLPHRIPLCLEPTYCQRT